MDDAPPNRGFVILPLARRRVLHPHFLRVHGHEVLRLELLLAEVHQLRDLEHVPEHLLGGVVRRREALGTHLQNIQAIRRRENAQAALVELELGVDLDPLRRRRHAFGGGPRQPPRVPAGGRVQVQAIHLRDLPAELVEPAEGENLPRRVAHELVRVTRRGRTSGRGDRLPRQGALVGEVEGVHVLADEVIATAVEEKFFTVADAQRHVLPRRGHGAAAHRLRPRSVRGGEVQEL